MKLRKAKYWKIKSIEFEIDFCYQVETAGYGLSMGIGECVCVRVRVGRNTCDTQSVKTNTCKIVQRGENALLNVSI